MIRATKVPQSPQSKVEEIVADADLAYFGNRQCGRKRPLLSKELQALTPMLTAAAWNEMQIEFLQDHHYFTGYAKQRKSR